ncbi:MAG TPA: VOC family protein [Actinomycetota bacterium]|nr:VOC family protein [Actinomycetota bacterium]
MGSLWKTVVIDSQDPAALARFWAAVLDFHMVYEDDNEAVIANHEETYPGMLFNRVPDSKTVKNRLHIDLAPDDRDAEVERLLALGARRVDVGQTGEEPWVVLADPEGNEFCVLPAHTD